MWPIISSARSIYACDKHRRRYFPRTLMDLNHEAREDASHERRRRLSGTWPDETTVRDLARRDSRTRTSKADRTKPHHACEHYDTDTSATSDNMNVLRTEQIGRSRAWRLLFSTDLHQATPSHAEPYCSSTWAKPLGAEPYCSPKTIGNMPRRTPIVP